MHREACCKWGRIRLQLRCTFAPVALHKWHFVYSNCDGELVAVRVATSRLRRATGPALNSISKKAFVANCAHVYQRPVHTRGQKFLTYAGERWGFGSAKHIWRDREIELVDETALQQRAK